MNPKSKNIRGVAFTIEIILVVVMGLIISLSLSSPQNNLISWQMCLGTLLVGIILACFCFVWTKIIIKKIGMWNDVLFVVGILFYTVFLYGISMIGRNSVHSLIDYVYVYNAAEEMASGTCSDSWNYFLAYPNNFKPTMLLSVLFAIAKKIGMQDPYPFALIFTVIQVPLAIIAARYLSGRNKEERRRSQCVILALFVLLLPIVGNVQSFYTDSMSFGLTIVIVALFVYAIEQLQKKQRFIACMCSVCGGCLLALAIVIKITVLIPLIAGGLIAVWSYRSYRNKSTVYVLLIYMLSMIVVYGGIELKANSYEIYQQSHETANPIISWVALGLNADGSYAGNGEFAQTIYMMSTKEEKTAYTKQYLADNINFLWDCDHNCRKIRCNFASGNLGLKDATYCDWGNENNIVWELFAPYGKYYWRTSQINFSYVFGIWSIYFVGGIVSVIALFKRTTVPKRMLWVDLTVIGLFLFLMIWEANNRQLYNQMPIILLGAFYHMMYISKIQNTNNE